MFHAKLSISILPVTLETNKSMALCNGWHTATEEEDRKGQMVEEEEEMYRLKTNISE